MSAEALAKAEALLPSLKLRRPTEALAEVGAKEGTLRRVPPKSSGGHGCKAVGLHSLFRIGPEPVKMGQ